MINWLRVKVTFFEINKVVFVERFASAHPVGCIEAVTVWLNQMRRGLKKSLVEINFQILKNIYRNNKGTTGEIELGVHVLSLLSSDGNLGSYLYAPKMKYKSSVIS